MKVAVAGGVQKLLLVNVIVTVAPLVLSFGPNVYVGVSVVDPAVIDPSPPLADHE